ncbi:hypothetical protein MKX03_007383 [Papaver bracteatum]|nr:hypothetical protein MKX03_007383 [Papaver bracteatum]
MAWRSAGSLSRSLLSTSRASSVRSSPALPCLRPPPLPTSPPRTRRFSYANPRTLGELGCTQSLLPHVPACHLSPHLSLNDRAFCVRMANTGHQMLQQRIKDSTNFQYMNGDLFTGTTLLMI